MTKYTPGPWRYEHGTKTIRSVPTNYWLGTLDSWDGAVKDQTEANGRLMAAAPALLAVLEEVMDDVSVTNCMGEADRAHYRALIAKATA